MTSEEAIKTIKIAMAEVEWNYPMDYAIAFENAISALEKQIKLENALDLINRQKVEIERLKALTENGASAIDTNNRLVQKFAEIKSEAIKEFAKELKNCFAISGDYLDIINIIDNLVKEMTEE